MTRVIQVHETGAPEVLRLADVEVGDPGPGQVRLRQTAIGLNFIDVYFRSGVYPAPQLPFVPGQEGAGVIEAVGQGVTDLRPGQRVAYAGPLGAYAAVRLAPADRMVPLPDEIPDEQAAAMMLKGMTAEYLLRRTYPVKRGQAILFHAAVRLAPADRMVPLPDDIPDEQAAAMMLKGMTAEYLLRRTYPVKRGQTILFHAAAGGVGLIACQWAKHQGATVIGTVGSEEKAELARAHGCDHPIIYTKEDVVARVKELTGGKGVPVVYDSVGQATFNRSLDCLQPRGMMVTFGQSSGKLPPLDTGILAQKGSLYLTRPTLMTYVAARSDLLEAAGALFDVVRSGAVRIEINQRYPLDDVVRAHRELEGRKTTGSSILLP